MRLRSFSLYRYGNHEAERIEFDPAPGVVNVLMAPNSAGKSVFRNAFGDLLHGIHNQTPMDFRFGYAGMRLTAEILRPDGETIAVTRRKTRGNVVTGPDGEPLDAGVLAGILGSRDRKLLERLFVLDTESLRLGGKALLDSGGDVASALLSAAGGIRTARTLKQQLERQRDELAPLRRTASRPFYLALARFTEARARTRAETHRPEELVRREQELEALDATRRTEEARAEAASAAIARLERVRRVRPALAKQDAALAWLAAHPDLPRLNADLGGQLTDARIAIGTARDNAARLLEEARQARDAAAEAPADAGILAQADRIEAVVSQAGAARKARDDLPSVRGQYEQGQARIANLLHQLGSPLPPDRANELLPRATVLARARDLIRLHGETIQSLREADTQIETRAAEREGLDARLAALPAQPDIEPLETLLAAVREAGDPAIQRAEAEGRLEAAETARLLARGRLPDRIDPPPAPLAMEIYARHEQDMAQAQSQTTTERQRLGDERTRLEAARQTLHTQSLGGTIPDEAAQDEARSHRDRVWRLIYRRAFTGDPPDAHEVDAETKGEPLPLAFERAIARADEIADRRFAESDRAAGLASARRAVEEAGRLTEAASQRLRLAEEISAQTRRAWTQLCAALPLGENPVLTDIQSYRELRERAIEADRQRGLAAEALTALRRRHDQWAASLGRLLGQDSSDLSALLTLAARRLADHRKQREERLKLETRLAQAARQEQDARRDRLKRAEAHDAWLVRWRSVLADLGRPETEEPVETEAVIDLFRGIAAEHKEGASLSARIAGMAAEIERFTQAVRELDPNAGGDPFGAASALGQALTKERAREERRLTLMQRSETAEANAEAAVKAHDAARSHLASVLALAKAETIEDAERNLALSGERARFEVQRDAAEADLLAVGDGLSLDVLRAEVEEIPPDAVAQRIEALAAERREAVDSAQKAAMDAHDLRQKLKREAEDTGLNTAAADRQAAAASLERTLEEALLYHTASLLLGKALEAVEQSSDSSLLRRLTETFGALTLGAYTRVVTEMDDNGAARLAFVQRDFPEERQTIEQMSEGTRDQFFLALRVAAIEDHVAAEEPLPFIGDDILQTFDDDRSLAALRVLADLSRHTQVIVLTHHRHILDLAERLPIGTIFRCRRISEAAPV